MPPQEGRKEAFVYKNPRLYTATEDTVEERQRIAKLLEKKNFMVNVTPVAFDRISELIESTGFPEEVVWAAIESGMVWVNCHVEEENDLTYPIENGKPVCFDMSTGRHVTGLNPKWSPNEYVIVGIAWKEFQGPGFERIPIMLQRVFPAQQSVMFAPEEEVKRGEHAKARIVDPKTLLTKPGPKIIVYDDEKKWFAYGAKAESGDDGGDDVSTAMLGWAEYKNDSEEESPGNAEDPSNPQTFQKYSIVSIGTFYRYIKGMVSGVTEFTEPGSSGSGGTPLGQVLYGWDGDKVYPDAQLTGLPCQILSGGDCFYYAVFNETRRRYECFEFCCIGSSSSSSFSSSSKSSSSSSEPSSSSYPSSSESHPSESEGSMSSESFSSSSNDCEWISVLTSIGWNRGICEIEWCEREICIDPERTRPEIC